MRGHHFGSGLPCSVLRTPFERNSYHLGNRRVMPGVTLDLLVVLGGACLDVVEIFIPFSVLRGLRISVSFVMNVHT